MNAVALPSGQGARDVRFGDGGVLRGVVGESLTPELFASLGVILGGEGKAALGWSGGDAGAMLARALGAGICAGGGMVLAHDGCCPAVGAWLGDYYGLPASLFVEQAGARVFLHWFGARGLPPEGERVARLERLLHGEGGPRADAGRVGRWERLGAVNTAYAADAARRVAPRRGAGRPVTVSVPGEGPWDQALTDLLERMGCRVLRRAARGTPCFSAAHGGFWLRARQEDGTDVDGARLLALIALLELERGNAVAVPPEAPAVIDALGGGLGVPVLRPGRDRGARETCAGAPWLRDALFAAGYLAAAMEERGESLGGLLARLPPFTLRRTEIPLRQGPGALMEAFTSRFRRAEPAGTGVRLPSGAGWVYVAPLIRRPSVRLQAEGADAETAQELCGFYEEEIRRLDRGE